MNQEFEPCVNMCVLCNFWWMQIDSEKLRTREALRSNLAQPTFYPTHVETEVQRGKATFLRLGAPTSRLSKVREAQSVPHNPLLSATHRLKGWKYLAPFRSLVRQGMHGHSLCQSASFPRALPPASASGWKPLDRPKCRESWGHLRTHPCLKSSLGHVSTKKELDFFLVIHFRVSLQVELGYVISLVKKLPAGTGEGLHGEDGLEKAQCCFGDQHPV